MKINEVKILLYLFLIAVFYIGGSLLLSPSGFFINVEKIDSVPIEKAIKNNTLIELARPDSVLKNIMKDDFYVYKYDFCYLENYGLLRLFNHRVTIDKQCYYKFIISKPLMELSEFKIQYNDLSTNLFNDIEGYNALKSSKVLIIVSKEGEILYKALYK